MQSVADIFHHRQDEFDDDGEELGDLHRPWRDDAAERSALAKRAGHVRRFLFGGCARKSCRTLQQPRRRITKAKCPAAVAPGTSPTLVFSKPRFGPQCQEAT